MPQTATIENLQEAFEVVKAMQTDGLDWGEEEGREIADVTSATADAYAAIRLDGRVYRRMTPGSRRSLPGTPYDSHFDVVDGMKRITF